MKFEFEYVGYMDFKNKEEALEFAYELEEFLGESTKENINLYLSGLKEMS